MDCSGSWVGTLRGTVVGNLFAEFQLLDSSNVLTLRFGAGAAAIILKGNVSEWQTGGETVLVGGPSGVVDLQALLKLDASTQDKISGRWELPDGNAGVFDLYPVNSAASSVSANSASMVYIVNRSEQLPQMTLYKDEVQGLINKMKSILKTSFDVVIKVDLGKRDISTISRDFWQMPLLPNQVSNLSLSLTEPGVQIPRVITINLNPTNSYFSVSGPDDVWVSGVSEVLQAEFRNRQWLLRTLFERHGMLFNSLVFIIFLTASPSLQLVSRALLLVFTIAVALGFRYIHRSTVVTKVFLTTDYKPASFIDVPRLLTTLLGTALVASVGAVSTLLSDENLRSFLAWIQLSLSSQN